MSRKNSGQVTKKDSGGDNFGNDLSYELFSTLSSKWKEDIDGAFSDSKKQSLWKKDIDQKINDYHEKNHKFKINISTTMKSLFSLGIGVGFIAFVFMVTRHYFLSEINNIVDNKVHEAINELKEASPSAQIE